MLSNYMKTYYSTIARQLSPTSPYTTYLTYLTYLIFNTLISVKYLLLYDIMALVPMSIIHVKFCIINTFFIYTCILFQLRQNRNKVALLVRNSDSRHNVIFIYYIYNNTFVLLPHSIPLNLITNTVYNKSSLF